MRLPVVFLLEYLVYLLPLVLEGVRVYLIIHSGYLTFLLVAGYSPMLDGTRDHVANTPVSISMMV